MTLRLLLLLVAATAFAPPVGAQTFERLATEPEALARAFPGARLEADEIVIDATLGRCLERRLGMPEGRAAVVVWTARDAAGAVVGKALASTEIGRLRPLELLVATDAALRVRAIEVLVVREPGAERAAAPELLSQYAGLGLEELRRPGHEVRADRATMPFAFAVTRGVRRTLVLLEELARPDGHEPCWQLGARHRSEGSAGSGDAPEAVGTDAGRML